MGLFFFERGDGYAINVYKDFYVNKYVKQDPVAVKEAKSGFLSQQLFRVGIDAAE